MYFDDFKTGDVFELKSVNIEKQKMLDFAAEYDPLPIHNDEEFGKASRYGDIIAPGIASYMKVWSEFIRANIITDQFIASQSVKINWVAPVFSGDVLTGKVVIKNVIPRNAYNGLVEVNILIYDQDGKLVMDTLLGVQLKKLRLNKQKINTKKQIIHDKTFDN